MAAATVVAAFLRFFRLGSQSLWIDEVFTWMGIQIGSPLMLKDLLENVHGALYHLILKLWCGVAGDSEWALRTPSAVAGVAMVPAMAWLARAWLGRDAVMLAAWLTAGSPFLVWYSQETRGYALLLLFVAISAALLLELARAPRVRTAIGYVAAAGAGLLSNFSFLTIAPLHLAWWIGGPEGRARRMKLLAIAALALVLIALPWVPGAVSTWDWQRLRPGGRAGTPTEPLRGGTTFHPGAIPFTLHSFAVGYTMGPSLRELRADVSSRTLLRHGPEIAAVALVFGLLGVLGLCELARRRRLLEIAVWLLAPAIIVSYLSLQNFKVFHPRYLSVAFPGFLLVLAAAFVALGRRARVAAGLAVAALWLFSLGRHYFDPSYAKEDYRAAAVLVRERGVPGEILLAVNSEDPMSYYYRGPLPQKPMWLGFAARPQAQLEGKIEQALEGVPGAWVVLSRPEDLDPGDRFARTLEERYPAAERWALNGVRVWHIRRS